MEVFVANADGSDANQVTNFGQANWAPAFIPDSKRIIFATNHKYNEVFPLIFIASMRMALDYQITHSNTFDAFRCSPPMVKRLFSAATGIMVDHDTNVFIADWVE